MHVQEDQSVAQKMKVAQTCIKLVQKKEKKKRNK